MELSAISERFEQGLYCDVVNLATERIAAIADSGESRISLWLMTALSYASLGNHKSALESIELALQIYPSNERLLYNYAVLLAESSNVDGARSAYQACLRINPYHADALWNAGELFRVNNNFDIAYQYLKRFEALGLNRFALSHRLAVCASHLHKEAEARAYFEAAMKTEPHPLTTWEDALFELSDKNYWKGWDLYRQRFLASEGNSVYCQSFGLKSWRGDFSELKDRSLLILPEQGLGDQVQFAAAIELLSTQVHKAGGKLVLVTRECLFALFAETFSRLGVEVYPHELGWDFASITAQHPDAFELPIGDVPFYAGYIQPQARAYLKAPKAAVKQAGEWLSALSGKSSRVALSEPIKNQKKPFRVGIAWGTNAVVNPSLNRRLRDIPVEYFSHLDIADKESERSLVWVSLMVGDAASEIGRVPELDAVNLSYLIHDFADTAGVIAHCDLVVTPCTSIAHVAGALGKEVLLLLQKAGDWRWGGPHWVKSDWYKNVHIIRQAVAEDWLAPIAQVKEIIASRMGIAAC